MGAVPWHGRLAHEYHGHLGRGVVVVKEDPLTYKDYGHELESFLHDQGIPKPEEAEKKAIVEAFSGITRSQAARIMALCFVTQKKLDADWIKNYLESQK